MSAPRHTPDEDALPPDDLPYDPTPPRRVPSPDGGYQPGQPTLPPDVYPTDGGRPVPTGGAPSGPLRGAATTAAARHDPTVPLQDDSGRLGPTLTGPAAGSGGRPGAPLFGPAQSGLQSLGNRPQAPESDYARHFHDYTEHDYKQNADFAHAVPEELRPVFRGDDISQNDLDRITFGSVEPAKAAAADNAQNNGKEQLGRYAQAINSGDVHAAGTAEDILKQAEPALAFFEFFAPAYNDWTGAGVSVEGLTQEFRAEYGLSFAAYAADAAMMADLSQQLVGIEQGLDNAYNQLVPTWHGAAASAFEAKMTVFFRAANTVTQDVAVAGKDVGALVHGLQQLVLAKAQTVSELYAARLPEDIDGVMARTMVKVAKGEADLQTNVIAFYLLSGKPQRSGGFVHWAANALTFGGLDDFDQEIEQVVAAQQAPQLAANWCNSVLVPQFETREQALHSVDVETKERIEQGFAEFTRQLSGIQDPFLGMDLGMDKVTAPSTGGAGNGPGGGPHQGGPVTPPLGGGGAGPGASGSGTPGITMPATTGATIPQSVTPGAGTSASTGAATAGLGSTDAGITRPSGLPAGAGWIPPGVPLPQGWTADPQTGEVLPQGWSVDPSTGLPTPPAGSGARGGRPSSGGPFDPAKDIHKNSDGSVSLGADRGLTISPESGAKGTFTLTDTDLTGARHTYTVHFDAHGNPVVTEVAPDTASGGPVDLAGAGGSATDAASSVDLGAGAGGAGGGGIGGGAVAGLGGGGIGGIGAGPVGDPAGAGAAASGHGGPDQLQEGVHVGADNAMSASSAAASGPASPVAGAAAGPEQGGHAGGGFGAMPMGGAGARGAGGGQEQESSRRYQQRGDVVGEDDLEDWQRMGPVIGER